MKLYLTILVFFFCQIFAQAQQDKTATDQRNIRIGLSLSGGGAKGFAHVGVLKILDSLGVKVDYISGTSMGAIVGGLYAAGYTGKEIEKLILDTDFYSIIANEKSRKEGTFFNKSVDKYILNVPIKDGKINLLPKAISTGQKNIYLLKELFKNFSGEQDFSKLPIPFLCVATNLESGKMKIFEKGDLVNSIMASSAFPSLMDPVKIGDSLYIDGAMTMNYPSKPLKDKGIDYVIGVDLNQPLATAKDLQSAVSILNQVIDMGIKKSTAEQYKYTDLNIKPDLDGFSATSYDDKEALVESGYTAAKNKSAELGALPKRNIGILRAPFGNVYSSVYKIDSFQLQNSKIFGANYVRGKMNLKIPSLQTYGSINQMVDKLYATNNYTLINYDITDTGGRNNLVLNVTEDDTRLFLKFGLHYDEVMKTGLLLNLTAKRFLFRNSIGSLDIVFGDKPRYYFNYLIDNGYLPGFGINSSGMSLDLKDKDANIFDSWRWLRNEVFLQSVWRDKYAVGGGLSQDYFERKQNTALQKSINTINPYVFIKSDTRDDTGFPTRGIYLDAQGKIFDLFSKNTGGKQLQMKIVSQLNFPISQKVTFRMSLFGGFTLGSLISDFYAYRAGGIFEQNLGNFTALPAYRLGQLSARNMLTADNTLQFNVYKNYFISADFAMANLFPDIRLKEIIHITNSSAGITAGYKSPFGQIKLNYSHTIDSSQSTFNVILGNWF